LQYETTTSLRIRPQRFLHERQPASHSQESNGTAAISTDSDAGTGELEFELNNDQFKPTEDSFRCGR
jgi:hypothetical protein